MDTLALLCNLHADGPATLRELQRIGCRSAQELATIDAPALARALDSDEDYARWFRKEADRLAERFAQPIAEPETAPIPRDGPVRKARAAPRSPISAPAPQAPLPAAPPMQAAQPLQLEAGPSKPASRAPAALQAKAITEDTVLRPGLLDGLDEAWCGALVHQGIRTIGGLVEDGSMALARRLGRPYTRLVDLQSLAVMLLRRSATMEHATSPIAAEADETVSETNDTASATTDAPLESGNTDAPDDGDSDEAGADEASREFTLFPRAHPRHSVDDALTHDPFSGGGWGAHHDPGTAGPFS